MCIGIPMQVLSIEPGHAICAGRGEQRRVRTALTGEPAPGTWLLVFLDSAQDVISPARAAEINSTLDLLAQALGEPAHAGAPGAAAFDLPSHMTREQLLALSNAH